MTIIFLIISTISKSIMDILLFHYHNSIFSKVKNDKWWNPEISWKNKWKNGDPEQGERFFGSSTFLVSITDAWHFFQHIMILSFILSIVVYIPIFGFIIDFLILYLIYTCTFELFFSKILKSRMKNEKK